MNYQTAKPSYPLSLFVKNYWAIDNCLTNGKEHIQRIIPNGIMSLTFYLCNRPKSLDNNKQLDDNTLLNGQLKSFYDIAVSDHLAMFSISFEPHGAYMFFDIPAAELIDQNVPLKHLIKDVANELESKLFDTPSFTDKISIAEQFLTNRLRKHNKKYEISRITNSIDIINKSRGLITVDALASASCLSRKQYERTFLTHIGTTPKSFLKTVRFQNTLHEKQKHAELSLTELAYTCGYFDQSHMINDYKQLSGITPAQYFSECDPVSDYFDY